MCLRYVDLFVHHCMIDVMSGALQVIKLRIGSSLSAGDTSTALELVRVYSQLLEGQGMRPGWDVWVLRIHATAQQVRECYRLSNDV